MDGLKIFDLYNNINDENFKNFEKGIDSSLKLKIDYDKVECNYEWIDVIDDTIKYLDNILRNPNRFIVNEEDVIKIELARRVTVESIKHLSRNTNLIQDYDKKTGDVKPSKILNINKEESFDTYENRFIYSLIQNIKSYIAIKKKTLVTSSSLKDNKNLHYVASSSLGKEKVNISLNLETKLNVNNDTKNNNNEDVLKRIKELEEKVSYLTYHEPYKIIEKKHIALVTSPIRKTNLIIKNVNFQYATKLWYYLQSHMNDDVERKKENKTIDNDEKLKGYIDETFMLNYLVLKSMNNDTSVKKEDVAEKITKVMVERLVDIDDNMTEEDLKKIVSKQFAIIKYKNVTNDKNIQNIFKSSIDKYLKQIKGARL